MTILLTFSELPTLEDYLEKEINVSKGKLDSLTSTTSDAVSILEQDIDSTSPQQTTDMLKNIDNLEKQLNVVENRLIQLLKVKLFRVKCAIDDVGNHLQLKYDRGHVATEDACSMITHIERLQHHKDYPHSSKSD